MEWLAIGLLAGVLIYAIAKEARGKERRDG